MTKRTPLAVALFIAVLAAAIILLHHAQPVRAQSTQRLQIASISLGPAQALTYPSGPALGPASPPASTQYLYFFPDEHMTFFPPASGSGPYLMFESASLSTSELGGTTVLQSTDLKNFTFATSLGYQPLVMVPPVKLFHCDPTYDTTSFDENNAGPGFVGQDPTLPAGNLVMLYEAENQCPGGVYGQKAALYSVGFARSSDNGKTWPPPANSLAGGPSRYPALQGSVQTPQANGAFDGEDLLPAGFIEKSLDGNNYLYATYSSNQVGSGGERVARAKLGQDPVSFQKWYNGSFSQPGIGGVDTDPTWNHGSQACPIAPVQASINYVDDIGLYLVIFQCRSSSTAYPWYYSTATSLDLQDWTPAQMIQNAQFPLANVTVDGFELTFMSPGVAPGHLHLTGNAFYNTTANGARTLKSRTFTITTQPQAAPVLTSGSLANGATYVAGGLVPGSWAQVQGTGLANTTRIWAGFDFLNLGSALPTALSGVQVMVNNTPAAVYYISPTQVNFQVPTGISGTASVQVIVNGTASNTLTAPAAASSPGLFPYTVKGVNYPASVHASNGVLVGPSGVGAPAQTGNFIELFATGLTSATGGIVPSAQQINGVTVTIGNVTIPATYAGQTAAVGEFQINFQVPTQFANMPAGNYPISISLNGVSSPATINSSPPGPIVIPVTP